MSVLNYLSRLKRTISPDEFEIILNMVDEDIKFNNVRFGKTTSPDDFISRCMICHSTFTRC